MPDSLRLTLPDILQCYIIDNNNESVSRDIWLAIMEQLAANGIFLSWITQDGALISCMIDRGWTRATTATQIYREALANVLESYPSDNDSVKKASLIRDLRENASLFISTVSSINNDHPKHWLKRQESVASVRAIKSLFPDSMDFVNWKQRVLAMMTDIISNESLQNFVAMFDMDGDKWDFSQIDMSGNNLEFAFAFTNFLQINVRFVLAISIGGFGDLINKDAWEQLAASGKNSRFTKKWYQRDIQNVAMAKEFVSEQVQRDLEESGWENEALLCWYLRRMDETQHNNGLTTEEREKRRDEFEIWFKELVMPYIYNSPPAQHMPCLPYSDRFLRGAKRSQLDFNEVSRIPFQQASNICAFLEAKRMLDKEVLKQPGNSISSEYPITVDQSQSTDDVESVVSRHKVYCGPPAMGRVNNSSAAVSINAAQNVILYSDQRREILLGGAASGYLEKRNKKAISFAPRDEDPMRLFNDPRKWNRPISGNLPDTAKPTSLVSAAAREANSDKTAVGTTSVRAQYNPKLRFGGGISKIKNANSERVSAVEPEPKDQQSIDEQMRNYAIAGELAQFKSKLVREFLKGKGILKIESAKKNAYKPTEERNQQNTCYVGNLDDQVTEALLWELMLQAGPVVNIHLPKDRVTQSHQGFGFAEFQTEDDAEYAIKIMHMIKVFGKPIRVNKASDNKRTVDVGANLFIGNLDPEVDEKTLHDTFSAFGVIAQTPKVARDAEVGVSKGYGFVAYDNFESADAAIEAMNGQFLGGKPITVAYAFKKDGQGERHGSAAERLLAAQAQKNAPTHMPNRLFAELPTPGMPGMAPGPPVPMMPIPGMAPPPMMMPPPPQQPMYGYPPMPMPGYQMPPPGFAPPPMSFGQQPGMPPMPMGFMPPPGFPGQYPPPQWPQQ
ncbi:hypothetical protein HDU79_008546 [Rhizoclosmatium sp. JEL0117]|nr:hypothetical protein HDU79_008546 [Rhizoclosmatium sp. JEL0117]